MLGNSFGTLFKIVTFGESHGGAIGAIIDGCPAGLKLSEKDIQPELDRRKPGQSKITTQRKEKDKVQILSGVCEEKALGTPILLLIKNKDANPKDYLKLKDKFRPSHADFTYFKKYGIRNWQGGGRASARETAARVAAGAIAKKILREKTDTEILAFVSQVGDYEAKVDIKKVKLKDCEKNIVRCPDQKMAQRMIKLIENVKKLGDSVGGIVTLVARNVPIGLGEPVFDKLSADLAKAMFSIPAVKAFEIGSGKDCLHMFGSEHNDIFYSKKGKICTKTNNSGGIQGGISNGEDIILKVTFKPTATISKKQETVNLKGKKVEIQGKGRHDPCVVPRAVQVMEAMAGLVLVDHYLRNLGSKI